MIFCIYFEQFYVVIAVTDHIALGTHFYSQLAINDFFIGRILRDDAIPFFRSQTASYVAQHETTWISF